MSDEKTAAPPPEPVQPAPPAQSAQPAPPVEPERIGIEDFAKVQMRVGQVLEAEKVEGSRKLVKMKVDLGTEVRQVVAGIAESYDPATLINRKVVIVANLKPARLMGIESNGMVVAATAPGGRAVLATFAEDVPNGSLLR
jgi:methionyl-tRNA synthetase